MTDGASTSRPLHRTRRSHLRGSDGLRVAFADLHNHTQLSDGAGAPELAFATLRRSGLHVAALTDHAKIGWGALSRRSPCRLHPTPPSGRKHWCRVAIGLDDDGWRQVGALADEADDPGAFTALRGFEWTHPHLGHLNVWGSRRWIDPLHTSGLDRQGVGGEAQGLPGVDELLDRINRRHRRWSSMDPVWDWLAADPATAGRGGGADGLVGFNHPGREAGRFEHFRHDPRVAPRVCTVEAFNKTDDMLFAPRGPSPLVACLDAGWHVGLIGVSDEHGDDWGHSRDKGRACLWLSDLSRAGVADALRRRHCAATREPGLVLDATLDGAPMGSVVPALHGAPTAELALDLDPGPLHGRRLEVQVLVSDGAYPRVTQCITVDAMAGAPPLHVVVGAETLEAPWLVVRLADPGRRNARPGPPGHPCNSYGVAYASPWWTRAPR